MWHVGRLGHIVLVAAVLKNSFVYRTVYVLRRCFREVRAQSDGFIVSSCHHLLCIEQTHAPIDNRNDSSITLHSASACSDHGGENWLAGVQPLNFLACGRTCTGIPMIVSDILVISTALPPILPRNTPVSIQKRQSYDCGAVHRTMFKQGEGKR